MNAVIVAGYGDSTDYIESLTKSWSSKYGVNVYPYAFGTVDKLETYDTHWREFEDYIATLGKTAVIGISFGWGIAARALIEHPEIVNRVVCISGPSHLKDMNPQTVQTKYPMLEKSLTAFDILGLPVEKTATFRPIYDNVIPQNKVPIDGALNYRVPALWHGPGIAAALLLRAKTITNFIKEQDN